MRKGVVLSLVLFFLAASCLILPYNVNATPKTIVVPDDYSTISTAVANAGEGDTISVKKGTYHEQTLTINKTLSLNGENAKDTVITFHPSLIFAGYEWLIPAYTYDKSMRIYANGVEISGFTISAELTKEAPANLANVTLGRTDPPFTGKTGQTTGKRR